MARERMHWMDLLRGTAVVLVVVFHAGVIFGSPSVVAAFNNAAGPYRLAALFFASGLLLERSLAKGVRRYVDGKLRRIVWPYLLWTAVMAVVLGDDRWRHLGWWLFPAGSHTWFLSTLAGLFVVGFATQVVGPGWVAVVLLAVNQFVSIDATPYLHDVTWWGFFFFLGAALHSHLGSLLDAPLWMPAVGGAAMVLWSVFVNQPTTPVELVDKTLLEAAASTVGVVTIIWVLARAPRVWPLTWLGALGERSVVTYLVHYPLLLLAVRYVPWPAGGVGYLLLVAAVLAVCLVASVGFDRVRWAFEWPRRPVVTPAIRQRV